MITGQFQPQRAGSPIEMYCPAVVIHISGRVSKVRQNPDIEYVQALIDTGSDGCIIDKKTAAALSLAPLNTTTLTTAAGQVNANVYSVQITFANDTDSTTMLNLVVAELDMEGTGMQHRFVLGMSAIRHFDLVVRRSANIVSLTWADR